MALTEVDAGRLADNVFNTVGPFKNRIINGDMRIDQRNAGASVTPNLLAYPVDRTFGYGSVTGKFSCQQNSGSVTPPTGFTNYIGAVSLSAYTVPAGEQYIFGHVIEGLNVADLGWGSANAATVTLSFWVRSSLTGTFGGSLQNDGFTRSYPFSYAISAANTWEKKSITIPGDTTGTWLTNNGAGIRLGFSLGSGTTMSGTAGSWAGANYVSATGATSVVGTNGATFYITGVQLEAGSVATPFERRSYGQELALCQRYYQHSYSHGITPGSTNSLGMETPSGFTNQANNILSKVKFAPSMRAAPVLTGYTGGGTSGSWGYGRNGAAGNATVTFDLIGTSGCRAFVDIGAAWTGGFIEGHWTANAEL